jgi:hypothetical protein
MGPVPTNQPRSFGFATRIRAARVQENAGRSVRDDRKKADRCVSFVEIRLSLIRWRVLPRGDGFSGI